MKKLESRFISMLIKEGLICNEEREIIIYGLHQILMLSVNIITLILLGFLSDKPIQGLFFLLVFWPLRIYAGGYHAKTEKECFFLSAVIECIIFLCMRFVTFTFLLMFIISFLLIICIAVFAPIENQTKKLDELEYHTYKRKVCCTLCIEFIILCASFFFSWSTLMEAMMYSFGFLAFLLLTEKMIEG